MTSLALIPYNDITNLIRTFFSLCVVLISIPVLRMNTGTICIYVRKQLQ
jgi:hypothetical protein